MVIFHGYVSHNQMVASTTFHRPSGNQHGFLEDPRVRWPSPRGSPKTRICAGAALQMAPKVRPTYFIAWNSQQMQGMYLRLAMWPGRTREMPCFLKRGFCMLLSPVPDIWCNIIHEDVGGDTGVNVVVVDVVLIYCCCCCCCCWQ